MLGFGAVGESALAELPGDDGAPGTRTKTDTDTMLIRLNVELGVGLNDVSLFLKSTRGFAVERQDRTVIVPGERRRLD